MVHSSSTVSPSSSAARASISTSAQRRSNALRSAEARDHFA
jgi:hypothetical protein